jgi:hypothetical protein
LPRRRSGSIERVLIDKAEFQLANGLAVNIIELKTNIIPPMTLLAKYSSAI